MPLVAVSANVENQSAIRAAFRKMGVSYAAVKADSLESAAEFWMRRFFPMHFAPGNRQRYNHEPRSRVYRSKVKEQEGQGDGKNTDLIFSGMSRRWLRSSAKITGTSNQATLRMNGPGYFANPFIGRIKKQLYTRPGEKPQFTMIDIKRQPNKVKELTQVRDDERREIGQHLQSELRRRVNNILSWG